MTKQKSRVLARIASFSRPAMAYEIREGAEGVAYCSCPAWAFSKARPRSCKHLNLFEQTPQWQAA